jgi:predicted SprT family Zn-dependent metalloprotease
MNILLSDKLTAVSQQANELLQRFGLIGWHFTFDRARVRAGCCYYPTNNRPGRITLSVHFVAMNNSDEVEDTLRHELAHALAGRDAGHGPIWKSACLITGARPLRCYGRNVEMPPGAWKAVCIGCGRTHSRHRRPRQGNYHCIDCGPLLGRLIFTAQTNHQP